jgi:hypothetical protein
MSMRQQDGNLLKLVVEQFFFSPPFGFRQLGLKR